MGTQASEKAPDHPAGTDSPWRRLATYARRAPSPHNTQPARLEIVDDRHARVLFVPDRSLPVGDPDARFTQLTIGIFVETLRIAAHGAGYELDARYTHAPLRHGGATQKVADLTLRAADGPVDDLDPELILRRRTNRHPYDDREIPAEVLAELEAEARRFGHTLHTTTDRDAIRWVKEVNADALFHDLEHERYRDELGSWLRYSERHAGRTRDGLSPQALVLPGWLLKGFMSAHSLLAAPGIRRLARWVYMRTMRGIATVGWLQGDFVDAEDWTRAGHLMMRLWLILTREGIWWQPYGSVITTDVARSRMVERFGMREGDGGRDMVWLLVRMGYSAHEPVASHRLPLQEVVA